MTFCKILNNKNNKLLLIIRYQPIFQVNYAQISQIISTPTPVPQELIFNLNYRMKRIILKVFNLAFYISIYIIYISRMDPFEHSNALFIE